MISWHDWLKAAETLVRNISSFPTDLSNKLDEIFSGAALKGSSWNAIRLLFLAL